MNEILYEIDLIFRKGSWVLFPLFILSQSAWFLCFKQWHLIKSLQFSSHIILELKSKNKKEFLFQLKEKKWKGALAQICQSTLENFNTNSLAQSLQISTKQIQFSLNHSIKTIAIISKTLPLLGLFGTVHGIKITFDIIQEYGNGNPSILSSGISTALITTQSSLVLAIPLILFHNYLINQIHDIETKCLESNNQILTLTNKLKS